MTVISDYTSLQTAVLEYLARDQDTTLIARIPTFIQFFESKMNRTLYHPQMEQRSTATIDTTQTDPEFILLPSDFQTMRRVRLSSVSGKPSLTFKSGVQMDDYRTSIGDNVSQPLFFSIVGLEMEIVPTPQQNYTLEMIYRKVIPALSLNSSNWLLTTAPDLYLYGTLLESAPYLNQDARMQTWGAAFSATLDQLNQAGREAQFNAGPLSMRPSGVTP